MFRYWLYATVKLKCLLVTNDEMRDHIFELLGSSFFLKWKERHQVWVKTSSENFHFFIFHLVNVFLLIFASNLSQAENARLVP